MQLKKKTTKKRSQSLCQSGKLAFTAAVSIPDQSIIFNLVEISRALASTNLVSWLSPIQQRLSGGHHCCVGSKHRIGMLEQGIRRERSQGPSAGGIHKGRPQGLSAGAVRRGGPQGALSKYAVIVIVPLRTAPADGSCGRPLRILPADRPCGRSLRMAPCGRLPADESPTLPPLGALRTLTTYKLLHID